MGSHAVILSPHFDDAVLSCWHLLAGAGEVLVVNVFAGEPAAGVLGWWDRPDQASEADQASEEIVEALRGVVAAGARIYAPASLGDHHRDHTAVRAAALALHAEGANLVLYADLPHATVCGWPPWVLDGASSTGADRAGELWASQLRATGIPVERMVAAAHRLPADDHARKLEAVLAYRSQTGPLELLFGSSLEDPQLLGFEVAWRLPLMA